VRTIHKYPVFLSVRNALLMPLGSEILSVTSHDDCFFLWVLGYPDNITEFRFVEVLSMGESLCDGCISTYIDTVLTDDDKLALHFFEVQP